MLAQLTIPESQLQIGFWTFVAYAFAAIAWGVRVELRLAALARENQSQAESTRRNEKTMHDAISRMDKIHEDITETKNDVKWIKEKLK